MVLSAFASELLLKCLHVLDGNQPHNLHKLYRALPNSRKKQILARWNLVSEQLAGDRARIERLERLRGLTGKEIPIPLGPLGPFDALKLSRGVFEKMRYVYEDPRGITFLIGDLPQILRKVVLEIRPEWMVAPASSDDDPTAVLIGLRD